MLTLSKWANHHKWTARLLLVLLNLLLIACGIILGIFLFTERVFLPNGLVELCCGVLLLAVIFYPKKGKDKLAFYYQRLRFDGVIYGLAFVLAAFFGNQLLLPETTAPVSTSQPKATFIVYKSTPNTQPTPDVRTQVPKKRINRFFAKRLKKMARKVQRKMQRKKTNKAGKIFLFLLAIAAAVLLFIPIRSYACSLYCSGAVVAANVVLVGGITLLLGSLILLGIKLFKKPVTTIPPASG